MKPQTPQLVVVDEVVDAARKVLEAPVAPEVAAPVMPKIVVPDFEPKVVEAPESGIAASGF